MESYSPLEVVGQDAPIVPTDISRPIEGLFSSQNDAENRPYREQVSKTYQSPEKPAQQGLEEGDGCSENLSDSYLGYYPNPEPAPESHPGTTSDAKADDRQIGVRRRASRSIEVDPADDHNALCGAHHAERILSRPLNWMLTLNLPSIREAAPKDRPPMWKEARDTLRRFFRRNGAPFTFIMNRASTDAQGSGEHAHMMLHCPKALTSKLKGFVSSQWGSPAAHLRPATRDWWRKRNGRLQSGLNYCLQGISWCRAANMERDYHYGGAIHGLRTTWSTDIGPEAIERYKLANGIASQ